MNQDEFARWAESHASTFGDGCHKYLQSADAFENWYAVLKHCDVQHASEATRLLLAGELGEWRAFNDHPRLIRASCIEQQRAKQRRAVVAPTIRDSYRCLTCRDLGYVTVWSRKSIGTVLANTQVYLAKASMACNCELGKSKCRQNERTFDALVDPVPELIKPLCDQVEDLRKFLATANKPARPIYQEFASYAQ